MLITLYLLVNAFIPCYAFEVTNEQLTKLWNVFPYHLKMKKNYIESYLVTVVVTITVACENRLLTYSGIYYGQITVENVLKMYTLEWNAAL